jgi:hypothetical protein
MKKFVPIICIALLTTAALVSFKNNSTPVPKNYAASIKDKTWWGLFTYTGKTAEYYSVRFNADNTLLWNQLSGEYAGQWALKGKQLTITFSVSGVVMKADISSSDDNLVNITDNTAAYEINTGELIAKPNIPLDNTAWLGIVSFPATKPIKLDFKRGNKVTINTENSPIKTYTYTRNPSDAAIRIGTGFFGIIVSGSKMKGHVDSPGFTWQATKQ